MALPADYTGELQRQLNENGVGVIPPGPDGIVINAPIEIPAIRNTAAEIIGHGWARIVPGPDMADKPLFVLKAPEKYARGLRLSNFDVDGGPGYTPLCRSIADFSDAKRILWHLSFVNVRGISSSSMFRMGDIFESSFSQCSGHSVDGHVFDLIGGNTIAYNNCGGTCGPRSAVYRQRKGQAKFSGCNGGDGVNYGAAYWGWFGDGDGTPDPFGNATPARNDAGTGSFGQMLVTLEQCNLEGFFGAHIRLDGSCIYEERLCSHQIPEYIDRMESIWLFHDAADHVRISQPKFAVTFRDGEDTKDPLSAIRGRMKYDGHVMISKGSGQKIIIETMRPEFPYYLSDRFAWIRKGAAVNGAKGQKVFVDVIETDGRVRRVSTILQR